MRKMIKPELFERDIFKRFLPRNASILFKIDEYAIHLKKLLGVFVSRFQPRKALIIAIFSMLIFFIIITSLNLEVFAQYAEPGGGWPKSFWEAEPQIAGCEPNNLNLGSSADAIFKKPMKALDIAISWAIDWKWYRSENGTLYELIHQDSKTVTFGPHTGSVSSSSYCTSSYLGHPGVPMKKLDTNKVEYTLIIYVDQKEACRSTVILNYPYSSSGQPEKPIYPDTDYEEPTKPPVYPEKEVNPEDVQLTINARNLIILTGNIEQYSVKISPPEAADQVKLTWSIVREKTLWELDKGNSVIKITDQGLSCMVQGVTVGQAQLKVADSFSDASDQVTVFVYENVESIELKCRGGMLIKPKHIVLALPPRGVGETLYYEVTIIPENISSGLRIGFAPSLLSWLSNKDGGSLTALKEGRTLFTVLKSCGKPSCKPVEDYVNVEIIKPNPTVAIDLYSLDGKQKAKHLIGNETLQLRAESATGYLYQDYGASYIDIPGDAPALKNVIWESSCRGRLVNINSNQGILTVRPLGKDVEERVVLRVYSFSDPRLWGQTEITLRGSGGSISESAVGPNSSSALTNDNKSKSLIPGEIGKWEEEMQKEFERSIRCDNGHVYNPDKYNSCPFCGTGPTRLNSLTRLLNSMKEGLYDHSAKSILLPIIMPSGILVDHLSNLAQINSIQKNINALQNQIYQAFDNNEYESIPDLNKKLELLETESGVLNSRQWQ